MGAWLISNPMGWIILLGGTIAATVGLVDLFTTSVEEHREKLESLKSEYSDLKSELDGLKGELDGTQSRINELESKGKLTFTEAEELNNLRKQNNELQRSIDLLELQNKTKKKELNNQFVETMNSDIEQELYTRNENGEVVQYMPMSGQTATDDNEANYITQRFKDLEKLRDELSSASTEAEKERIKRQIKGIEDYFVQKNKDFTETAEGIDYIQNPTTKDDEKVNEWLDYIHDFQDKMAIAMGGDNAKENAFNRLVDNWKFDDLLNPLQQLGKEGKVTAEMLNDQKYDEFIQKLIDIGFISDDTEGSLRYVANAFNGTMQSAQKYVTSLKGNEINNFIKNLNNEAKALGTTESELAKLTAAHVIFNNTGLSTEQQQQALQMLAAKIATTSAEMKYLLQLFNYASGNFDAAGASTMTEQERRARSVRSKQYLKDKYGIDLSPIKIPEKEDVTPYTPSGGDNKGSSKDNTPDYEDPTDAIINRINLRADELAQQEEEIQNLIEIAELENDYKKQISLTNDLISNRKKRVDELAKANAGLHNEAEWLRDSNPWDEESWFDNQGNATESFVDFINGKIRDGATTEDIEAIKDLFEKISKYKKAYMANEEEIADLNKQILQDEEKIWDIRREIFDTRMEESEYYIQHSKDFGWENGDNEVAARKRVLDWIQSDYYKSLIEDDEEYYKILEENRLKYIEAQKDAMEKSISDIEDYIDARNHYDDWDAFGDSELEAINRQTEIIEDAYKQRLLSADEYVKRLEEYSQRIYSLAQDQINESLSNIDNYIDARNHYDDWDAFGDSEIDAIKRQCKILDKAYEENLMSLEDYTERSEEYAQKLYSIGQEYINKSLSDIDRYIDTRNAYDDWDNWGDTEIEAIKRQIDILDKAYAEKLMSLEEYTQKVEEYSKKLYSTAKDNIIETISKMIEDYEEMRQDEKDALSFESTQYSSLKTLLQSHYDVTNAIAEAQHEINKELRASKSMYEYLNKETRKLLFNQEDYDVLNEKLLDIQAEANALQEQYNKDILGASEETIAEITSQYQMQYELLMKQYDIAKAELDVAKKRQKLDNVLAERNVRMFINGQWQWVANTQKIIDAQNELADAEIEREQRETSLKQIDSINELTKAQDDITTQINYLETDLEKVREAWSEMQKMLNGESHEVAEALKQISQVSSPELIRVIEETGGNVVSFSASLSESIDTMSTVINTNLDTATSDILDNVVESVDDITSTVSDSISDIHDNISDGIDDINKTIIDGLGEYSDAIKSLVDKINGIKDDKDDDRDENNKDADFIRDTIAQMKENSEKWHSASEAEKEALHKQNQELGASIGAKYDEASGKWTYPEVKTSSSSSSSSSGKTSSSNGGSSSSSSSSSKQVNTTDQYVKSSNGIVQSNPNWDGKNKGGVGSFYKHADGTRHTPGGLTALGEEGFEAFINNNGHLIPINQPTIGNIGAGGIVFNQAQMENLRSLWDLSNMNKILPHISHITDNKPNMITDNSIHINGLVVGEQGNEDWINGLRRYVATHR